MHFRTTCTNYRNDHEGDTEGNLLVYLKMDQIFNTVPISENL